MVKGYEFAKDRYVTFTPDELQGARRARDADDRHRRVRAGRAGRSRLLRRAYYLGPDKGGGKAYRLLALALERAGKAALARYAARGKQYLVLIRPTRRPARDAAALLRGRGRAPPDEVPIEDAQPKDAEVQLALQLIEQTASDAFRPEQYEDAVKARVLAAIEKKVEGQEIQVAAPAEPAAQVIDLMDALKASLDAARGPGTAALPRAAPTAEAEPAERKAAKRARRGADERGKASSRK